MSLEQLRASCRVRAETAMSQLVRDAAAPGAARLHWDPSVGGKAAARVGPARFVSLPDYVWVPQEAAPPACVSTFQRLLWALHGKVSGTALGASAPAAAAHGAGPRHHHRGSRAWFEEVQTVLRQLRDAWNGTPFAFLRVAAAAEAPQEQGPSAGTGGGAAAAQQSLYSQAAAGGVGAPSSSSCSSGGSGGSMLTAAHWDRVKHLITGGFGLGASARIVSDGEAAAVPGAGAGASGGSHGMMEDAGMGAGGAAASTASGGGPAAAFGSPAAGPADRAKRARCGDGLSGGDESDGAAAGSPSSSSGATAGQQQLCSLLSMSVEESLRELPPVRPTATPAESFLHALVSHPRERVSLHGRHVLPRSPSSSVSGGSGTVGAAGAAIVSAAGSSGAGPVPVSLGLGLVAPFASPSAWPPAAAATAPVSTMLWGAPGAGASPFAAPQPPHPWASVLHGFSTSASASSGSGTGLLPLGAPSGNPFLRKTASLPSAVFAAALQPPHRASAAASGPAWGPLGNSPFAGAGACVSAPPLGASALRHVSSMSEGLCGADSGGGGGSGLSSRPLSGFFALQTPAAGVAGGSGGVGFGHGFGGGGGAAALPPFAVAATAAAAGAASASGQHAGTPSFFVGASPGASPADVTHATLPAGFGTSPASVPWGAASSAQHASAASAASASGFGFKTQGLPQQQQHQALGAGAEAGSAPISPAMMMEL
jgi:hypothetical protein